MSATQTGGSINSVHQFEALFNFATIGIVVTNKHGKIINFNKYAETQFGYDREEILGQTVDILLPRAAHLKHVQYRHQYYRHPEPRIMGHGRDLFAQGKNGTTFPVEVSLSHYVIGEETFVIAFIVDITVRKAHEQSARTQTVELERVTAEVKLMNAELEQKVEDRTKMLREALFELEKSKEELNLAYEKEKELNELKSGFVTVASHEFRTPLSTILSSAYLLEKYSRPHADLNVDKHVQRIRGAVKGMKNILEDFLSLGKMEEGRVTANIEELAPAEIENILTDLLEELEGLLGPNQQLRFANNADRNIWVSTDLLRNILTNLISNAIKFSNEDSQIFVKSFVENGEFVISVEDNGIGISEEDQQHLFERFFRAKNAGSIRGTGLGLHIVSRYLELMGGRIAVQSKLDMGTSVTIYVPQPGASS